MKRYAAIFLIVSLGLQVTASSFIKIAAAAASGKDLGRLDTVYWVSPDGQATWASCMGALPLHGVNACSLNTANTYAAAGDTVYLRAGTYTNQEIRPGNSGLSDSERIIYSNYNQETVML